MIRSCCVIGAGAWGTTIAVMLARQGHSVVLWEYFPEVYHQLQQNKENQKYLPGVSLDLPSLKLSDHLADSVSSSDLLILAIPSKYLSIFLPRLANHLQERHYLLSLVKGILPRPVPRLLLDDLMEQLPQLKPAHAAVLSGPNFAKEIAQDLPAATVIAGMDLQVLRILQTYFSSPIFRVYTNTDVVGVQLGGIMKNVIALAAGLLDGSNMGYNAKSSLIVRGIAEMGRLFSVMGGKQETLYGLSGLGDLILTCTSPLSRNWWAGTQLASGISYQELQKSTGTTVEGVDSMEGLLRLSRIHEVELPICREIYAIVFEQKEVAQSLYDLMSRKLRSERT